MHVQLIRGTNADWMWSTVVEWNGDYTGIRAAGTDTEEWDPVEIPANVANKKKSTVTYLLSHRGPGPFMW